MKDEVIIQIRVNLDLYNRAKRYFKRDSNKHYFTEDAFEKRVNFLEGRDKKLKLENLKKDSAYIQELLDSGEIKINV